MKDSQYATKYALIYSVLVGVVLLTPLFYYTVYMKNIYAIQNKLLLKEKAFLVVNAMQNFDANEEYFEYPRFNTFDSGLYDEQFQPVFTLIKKPIEYFKDGYHLDGNDAFLIMKLPTERYFGSSYLVVHNTISYATVYEKVFMILLSILVLVFILSVYFLKTFAKPFKKLNKQLDNFIKDSMHEINTPLSIINVNIDLYNRKYEQNKYFLRMKAAAKVLSNIYNDMDYLIKYEQLAYHKEDISLAEFIQERIDYFSEVAAMKNVMINTCIDGDAIVYMNIKELQRLVDNNLSNAIKYSHENAKIDINLYVQKSKCYLAFQDYGVGIKDVEKIFSRYYRENTEKGGFGIGLNIVGSIIKKEGIELQLRSKPGEGSLFLYIFPPQILK
ncbi:MAG: HAMP domain-containing histidine kinase [Epsilonproteobacteria bacterium]|nr:HAMP domain-containing histidine kinase [Campylobacterota bacterium]